MRLKPRTLKRRMFTCTECAECISACTQVQTRVGATPTPRPGITHPASLLRWVDGEAALPVVTGHPAKVDTNEPIPPQVHLATRHSPLATRH